MPRLFSIKPTLSMKGRKNHGLGGLSGKPLHPPLTDIPAAAYALTMVFDIIAFIAGEGSDVAGDAFAAATYVLIAGAIVSVPTTLTGFWDWRQLAVKGTQAWRTANWHMAVMLTVTLLVVVNIVVRLSDYDAGVPSATVLVLSILVGTLVTFGAMYGGALVYEYGFRVEASANRGAWRESEHDLFHGESAPNATPTPDRQP